MSADNNTPDEKIIEGHEYDGIKELDNPLPKWWVYLFYATIVYGVCYFTYYEFLGGPSHKEQYEAAMAKIEKKALANKPDDLDFVEVDPETLINDSEALKVGAASYTQVCAACHGNKGEGIIGPNLTDKYWIHSKGDGQGILVAIREGFPDKGMPAWKDIVAKEKHAPLAAFVLNLQGTDPPNAKDPQGELIE